MQPFPWSHIQGIEYQMSIVRDVPCVNIARARTRIPAPVAHEKPLTPAASPSPGLCLLRGRSDASSSIGSPAPMRRQCRRRLRGLCRRSLAREFLMKLQDDRSGLLAPTQWAQRNGVAHATHCFQFSNLRCIVCSSRSWRAAGASSTARKDCAGGFCRRNRAPCEVLGSEPRLHSRHESYTDY
jgi:hypothetical protein